MKTNIKILQGTAAHLEKVGDESVDLVVTSPPYPMIEMWDETFAAQNTEISGCLANGRGHDAFELMHGVLDEAWAEMHRVLRPGGIACVNIGDATRTIDGDFQLYSNHSRILTSFLNLGFATLPDILWRKPTNAPNKFMGSGMLPGGAYVTYEHEYILVLRKGRRRDFTAAEDKECRRKSAFFWEERNVWFSDIWFDIKGTGQELIDKTLRQRSAAYPFELAYRLICMFSVQGDVVLDPFAGTGTTLAAALTSGRNAVGIEFDKTLLPEIGALLQSMAAFAESYNRDRLWRHIQFVADRSADVGPLKYNNHHYGFPVMTAQERDLLIPEVKTVKKSRKTQFAISYHDGPQPEFVRQWSGDEIVQCVEGPPTIDLNSQKRRSPRSTKKVQAQSQL